MDGFKTFLYICSTLEIKRFTSFLLSINVKNMEKFSDGLSLFINIVHASARNISASYNRRFLQLVPFYLIQPSSLFWVCMCLRFFCEDCNNCMILSRECTYQVSMVQWTLQRLFKYINTYIHMYIIRTYKYMIW